MEKKYTGTILQSPQKSYQNLVEPLKEDLMVEGTALNLKRNKLMQS